MKKIGILTINDYNNYGNRLQNYATQQILDKLNVEPITILNNVTLNKKEKSKYKYFLRIIKCSIDKAKYKMKRKKKLDERETLFLEFNRNINFSEKTFNFFDLKQMNNYDYFITGSDQVWNPSFSRLREFDLLEFTEDKKKISFAASFGIEKLQHEYYDKLEEALKGYKAISVREESGKKIVKEVTGRNDVEVLVDPTMLLSSKEWENVIKKPKQLKEKKYILNYFLGTLSEKRRREIDRVAKENDCEVINLLDKNSPFYLTGPSEFLYLEKNAFLICTDSFHSSVFAILYNKPFIVFDREDNMEKMNSRLETLIKKFNLKDREFTGTITYKNLKHDYTEAYKILEQEKYKSISFLKKSLDLE